MEKSASKIVDYDLLFKIILVGESGVGKTNILSRLIKNEFRTQPNTTIGVEVGEKKFNVDGKIIKCQIWDTAGQAKYRAVSSVYYKGTFGALLVYDITDYNSFLGVEYWRKDILEHANSQVIILLVGNKYDLRDSRKVSHEEAEEYAAKNSLVHMYTSAYDAHNIELAFNAIVKESYNAYKKTVQGQTPKAEISSPSLPSNQSQGNYNLPKKTPIDTTTCKDYNWFVVNVY